VFLKFREDPRRARGWAVVWHERKVHSNVLSLQK
jgi:hypothetical protein